MSEILIEQWPLIMWATLAITFNMFLYDVDKGRYGIGLFFRQYRVIFELINWLVILGLILYLSCLYTWWFLLAFFIFPVLGLIISSIIGGYTQFFYIIGMPIFTIIGIMHLIQR